MALTPEDIVNHEFNLAVRGYAKVEVDDLLDRLADQIERAEKDLAELRDRLDGAQQRAEEASRTEETLKRTLVTAQDAAQRTVDDARSQADELLADARSEAAASLDTAERRAEELRTDAEGEAAATRERAQAEESMLAQRVAAMAAIEQRYRGQLRELLESQLQALGDLESGGPPGGDEVAAIRGDVEMEASDDAADADAPHEGARDVPVTSAIETLGLRGGSDEADSDPDGLGDDEDEDFPSFTGLKVRVHADEDDPS